MSSHHFLTSLVEHREEARGTRTERLICLFKERLIHMIIENPNQTIFQIKVRPDPVPDIMKFLKNEGLKFRIVKIPNSGFTYYLDMHLIYVCVPDETKHNEFELDNFNFRSCDREIDYDDPKYHPQSK